MKDIVGMTAQQLQNQATMTVDTYVSHALRCAREQDIEPTPEFISAYIIACTRDFHTAVLSQTLYEIAGDYMSEIETWRRHMT